MTHLALFNGIGGFQLAAAWRGWKNVAHVEIDDFCNKVVAKHFPESICHTDIKQFDGTPYRGQINIISGGFPCQPYSLAGKRLGKEDDRALWPEMLRVIKEVRPAWVVGENVAGIISMGVEHYIDDLEAEGYEVQAFVIPACAINAPHRRDRVWIVAYCSQRDDGKYIGNTENGQVQKSRNSDESSAITNTENAECKQSRDTRQRRPGLADRCELIANTNSARPQRRDEHGERSGEWPVGPSHTKCWQENWHDVALRTCLRRVDDGVSRRMDRGRGVPAKSKKKTAAGRTHRLKALGNAIVPQVAYEIFKAIDQIQ